MRPYHPNAATAANYFQISANLQYQSLVRLYSAWTGLGDRGIMPIDHQLALEAAICSLYAGWYAMAGASYTGSWLEHPTVMAAEVAYIELLVIIGHWELRMPPYLPQAGRNLNAAAMFIQLNIEKR